MRSLVFLLVIAGHAFLWIGLVNRLHAINIRRWLLRLLTRVLFGCAAVVPFALLAWWLGRKDVSEPVAAAAWGYVALCVAIAPVTLLRLAILRFLQRRPKIVRLRRRQPIPLDLPKPSAGAERRNPLLWLPWNETLQLEATHWAIDLPRLPPALDGLLLAHVSDLHLTGYVGKAYFREVIRATNELNPDLVVITGDIADSARCLDWIADTLGQLAARWGIYFVLGNHDRRVPSDRLRAALVACGMVDVGGREHRADVRGQTVVLAGNEAPWFNGRAKAEGSGFRVQGSGVRNQGSGDEGLGRLSPQTELRIALAHSPDQLGWARGWKADLMLAGHTHGGQIRIPPLGAVFSPSLHGVKYVSGVYHVPPTILHVSRGISSDIPIRWNCRPEIALLRLCAGRL